MGRLTSSAIGVLGASVLPSDSLAQTIKQQLLEAESCVLPDAKGTYCYNRNGNLTLDINGRRTPMIEESLWLSPCQLKFPGGEKPDAPPQI
jgi:hypothetical protein